MKASDLNWPTVHHFGPHEWPEGALPHLSAQYVRTLSAYRVCLGHRVHPGEYLDNWVRFDGSPDSRHYAVGRLSDAGDLFTCGNPRQAFLTACHFFSGVGIYLDTTGPGGTPWPMLHTDLRPEPLVWARVDGEYLYPIRGGGHERRFWDALHSLEGVEK